MRSDRFIDQPIPLLEVRQELATGTPTWIDHGVPGDHHGVAVGPAGAVSVIHDHVAEEGLGDQSSKYVFVATDPEKDGYGEGINGPEIAFLRGDGQNFTWNSLGAPASSVYGEPVAIPYYTGVPLAGGLGRLVVFAVARDGSGDFELFTQFHNGLGWDSNWQDHGAPPELQGLKFKMTSAVSWYQGPKDYSLTNLRISVFGYSEEIAGVRPGGLVEFFWNGFRWNWAPVRTAPDGQTFRTTHAVAMDDPDEDRVVVIGRTSTGRIWEYARQYDQYGRVSEDWTDLSFEPRFRLVGTSSFGN